MSVTDPIADMLTRIRNAVLAGHAVVAMPSSKMKIEIAKILKEEGYLENMEVADGEQQGQKVLRVRIKYIGERRERRPVITGIERISRPGRRVYCGKDEIPKVLGGLGLCILSTSQGILTGRQAEEKGLGGEVLCSVS